MLFPGPLSDREQRDAELTRLRTHLHAALRASGFPLPGEHMDTLLKAATNSPVSDAKLQPLWDFLHGQLLKDVPVSLLTRELTFLTGAQAAKEMKQALRADKETRRKFLDAVFHDEGEEEEDHKEQGANEAADVREQFGHDFFEAWDVSGHPTPEQVANILDAALGNIPPGDARQRPMWEFMQATLQEHPVNWYIEEASALTLPFNLKAISEDELRSIIQEDVLSRTKEKPQS